MNIEQKDEFYSSAPLAPNGLLCAGIRVLVGCEESQAICIAFRSLGYEAYSCDLVDCSGGKPEWHLKMDVFEAIDLIKPTIGIFNPPCTHLAVSGAKHFYYKQARQKAALKFVEALMDAPIEHIAIENPVSIISSKIRKPDQIIQPYQFGHLERKTTCLWLKNLPPLVETWNRKKEMLALPYKEYAKVHCMSPGKDRARIRSKTYEGIANAMAVQWSKAVAAMHITD